MKGVRNVTSNEIDPDLIGVAVEEADRYGFDLKIITYDWRDLGDRYDSEFHLVSCLGNSLTYLFRREEQLRTLRNFWQILKPGGKLAIDERNYAEQLPKNKYKEKYKYTGNFVYCGKDKVDAHPIHVSDSMVVFEYHHKEKQKTAHLVFYPFKAGEMMWLLKEAGFKDVKVYGDYKPEFKPEDPEFITYVARK